jgi:hypothetical protein
LTDPYVAKLPYTKGMQKILALFSDLHLEANDTDQDQLKKDLEEAAGLDARILINGDLVDMILPSDQKRHTASRDISHRDDKLNEITQVAYEMLLPVVDYIDVIGAGNHEAAVAKYHHFDIIGALVVMLNMQRSKTLPPIHRAGYQGYIRYMLHPEDEPARTTAFTIYHHHGSGGSAPVTKGMIDFNRIIYSHDADLWWMGHKHQGIQDPYIMRDRLNQRGKYEIRRGQAVQTPGYKRPRQIHDYKKTGCVVDYSEQFYGLQARGYAQVHLRISNKTRVVSGFDVIAK